MPDPHPPQRGGAGSRLSRIAGEGAGRRGGMMRPWAASLFRRPRPFLRFDRFRRPGRPTRCRGRRRIWARSAGGGTCPNRRPRTPRDESSGSRNSRIAAPDRARGCGRRGSARSGDWISSSISASMTGLLMPRRLWLPCWSAACEPQYSRCSLPGDSDSPNTHDRHVVVERVHPLLVLRGVDRCARRAVMPSRFRFCGKGQHDALELRVVEQDLEVEGLAGLVVDELLVLEAPAGLLQQLERLAQPVADIAGAVVFRRVVFLGEDLVAGSGRGTVRGSSVPRPAAPRSRRVRNCRNSCGCG